MGFYKEFPWTSNWDSNIHELLEVTKKLLTDYDFIVNQVNPTFASPIDWQSGTYYRHLTYVRDPSTGAWYVSIKDVPPGIYLDNAEYWTKVSVSEYDAEITAINERLTALEQNVSQKNFHRPTTICQGRVGITLPVANITTLESAYCIGEYVYMCFFNNANGTCIGKFPKSANPAVAESYVQNNILGHANSLTYDGQYLYTVTYTDGNIVKINPDTLAMEVAHTFSKNYLNCVYDMDRSVFYLMPAVWDGTLDIANRDYQIVGNLAIDIPAARQSPYIDGKNMYFLQSGYCNYIYAVNKWTGECESITAVNLTDELEAMFVYEDQVYLGFNNQLDNTDYYIGCNLFSESQSSQQFTQDAIGRYIKLSEENIKSTGIYKLQAAPQYFSHIIFKFAAANGTYIGDSEVFCDYDDTGSFFCTKQHITSDGSVWTMGIDGKISVSEDSPTLGVLNAKVMVMTTWDPSGTHVVHKSTDSDWSTNGFYIVSIYGESRSQAAQNIGT